MCPGNVFFFFCISHPVIYFMLRPGGHHFSLCVAFRVDTGKPARSSFNITPGSSWPSSRWHRMTTLKRAWYRHFFYLFFFKMPVLMSEYVPVYWSVCVCVCVCMFVASAGPGACLSAEWYSLPEDIDKPCWSGHNQWTQTSQVLL